MILDDEPSPVKKPHDLQKMSVAEIEDYIARLEAEITEARKMIEAKQAHHHAANAIFGKPK